MRSLYVFFLLFLSPLVNKKIATYSRTSVLCVISHVLCFKNADIQYLTQMHQCEFTHRLHVHDTVCYMEEDGWPTTFF